MLHLDGDDLLDRPLARARRDPRRRSSAQWRVPAIETDDPDAAEAFLADALATGHEGVMVKALDSPYEAGRRGASWRKVKPVRTLDLVVLARSGDTAGGAAGSRTCTSARAIPTPASS